MQVAPIPVAVALSNRSGLSPPLHHSQRSWPSNHEGRPGTRSRLRAGRQFKVSRCLTPHGTGRWHRDLPMIANLGFILLLALALQAPITQALTLTPSIPVLVQRDESAATPLFPLGVCRREGARILGTQPLEPRGKVTLPRTIKRVQPQFPPLPTGTTVVTNYWIGEALIDGKGHVAEVWTVKEPKLMPAFPAVSDAILSALRQWEWQPLIVDKKARPFCRICTLRIDWP